MLRLLFSVFVLLSAPQVVWAAVTFSGTNGVQANVLTSNSVSACSGCHDGNTAPNFTSSYTAFSSYATTYHSGSKTSAVQRMMDRTNLSPGDGGFMPDGAGSSLSSAEKSLLSAWKSNGAVNTDYPTTTTISNFSGSNKVFKTSSNSAYFTLRAWVDDSGIGNTWYDFQYGLSATPTYNTTNQYVSGSGGGTSNTYLSQQLSNMQCGTTYYYRVRAYNSTYGYRYGTWRNDTSATCNTGPTIQSTPLSPGNATEDTLWQFDINANDDGLGGSVVYSLSNEPSGMSINSSSGLISWTPNESQHSSGTVTVIASDNGADGAVVDSETFSISVNQINDAPNITSSPGTNAIELVQYSYQLTVSDPDHSGAQLSYSLSGEPAGMVVSSSGLITWTPAKDVTTSGLVEVTVTDALAATDSQSFTITVASTNTAPRITSSAPNDASEDIEYVYVVQVIDDDDANNGVDLRFSLTNEPDEMLISPTGTITWTPLEGQGNVSNIVVTVEDGGENDAEPDTETFSIAVASINDEPILAAVPNQGVQEGANFSLNMANYLNDPDDTNNGMDLIWSLSSPPAGMSISNLGQVTWSPGNNTSGNYVITVLIHDGFENGSEQVGRNFNLSVGLLDADNDGIADYDDNCINTSNTNQLNSDGDSQGNACDTDDDNDGISDVAELANNLDPTDANDAALDADDDGLTNLQEFEICSSNSDADCLDILSDNVPPQIITTGTITVDSTGYFTQVDLTASATDAKDGAVSVSPDKAGPFRPGRHTIIWSAQDAASNQANENQTLDVLPQLRVAGSTITGEGQTITVPISLSGEAPLYPVNLNISFGGTAQASDYNVVSNVAGGLIAINSGTSVDLVIDTASDGSFESDETLEIIVSTDSESIAQASRSSNNAQTYSVHILDRDVAPSVDLSLSQNSLDVPIVYQDQGNFNLVALASDANGDSLTWTWSATLDGTNNSSNTNTLLTALNANVLSSSGLPLSINLDPLTLTTGFYLITASVSDGQNSTEQNLSFHIKATAPVLNTDDSDGDGVDDITEGFSDTDGDGLADYLDPINDSQFMHKQLLNGTLALIEKNTLLKTQSDQRLVMGSLALEHDRSGVRISSMDINSTQNEHTIHGDILDFEIHGTHELNPFGKLIIPLDGVLPANAEYWKYIEESDQWKIFDQSLNDFIGSSQSINGVCPDEEDEYNQGLTQYDDCILLLIEDGGLNDSDGKVNGTVRDPGAILINNEDTQSSRSSQTVPTSSPGGSGSLSWVFLSLLTLLLINFYIWRRNKTLIEKHQNPHIHKEDDRE